MWWTIGFVREHHRYMTLRSVLRYRRITLRNDRKTSSANTLVRLKLQMPVSATVLLREFGTDFLTLREVFLDQVYAGIDKYVPKCRTIIDLGANIGLAAIYFTGTFTESRVFCVEPAKDNFRVLQQNIARLEEAGRCRIVQAAVWNEDCRLKLHEPGPGGYWGYQVSAPSAASEGAIAGLSMNSIIDQSGFQTVDLLKVDIEGAEVELFSGDTDWLRRVGAVAIEFHGDSRSRSGFDAVMKDFDIVELSGHTVLAVAKAV